MTDPQVIHVAKVERNAKTSVVLILSSGQTLESSEETMELRISLDTADIGQHPKALEIGALERARELISAEIERLK